MSVDNSGVVDAVGVEPSSEKVVLLISDHLDWVNEVSHVAALREKLDRYLRFVESGDLIDSYPKAKGRAVVIQVTAKHALTEAGERFYKVAKPELTAAGIELRFQLLTA